MLIYYFSKSWSIHTKRILSGKRNFLLYFYHWNMCYGVVWWPLPFLLRIFQAENLKLQRFDFANFCMMKWIEVQTFNPTILHLCPLTVCEIFAVRFWLWFCPSKIWLPLTSGGILPLLSSLYLFNFFHEYAHATPKYADLPMWAVFCKGNNIFGLFVGSTLNVCCDLTPFLHVNNLWSWE